MHGWEPKEAYPCEAYCFSNGRPLEGRRRMLRCALVDPHIPVVSEEDWGKSHNPMRKHMGLPPILDNERFFSVANPRAPEESHEDGCPGSWYRCDFVFSVQNYERLYHHQSGFQSNEMLNRTDDALVLQATAYLENQILLAVSADQDRELANK